MMSTTKVLIAEDEPLAAEALADWVRDMPQLELIGIASNGEAALAEIRARQPDLVLMDIQMPGLTGLQVLRALGDEGQRPAVIFTTAYDEHALAAFELHAVDYLLKPFSHERFVEAVEHATQIAAPTVEALQAPSSEPLTRLMVRDQGKIFPLQVDEI